MINSCWLIKLAVAVIAKLDPCWVALSTSTCIFQSGKQWDMPPHLASVPGLKAQHLGHWTGLHEPSAAIPQLHANTVGLWFRFFFCLFRENIIFRLTLGLLWRLWDNTDFHIQLFHEITVGPAVRTVWHHGDLYKIWVNYRNGNFKSLSNCNLK